MAQLSGTGRLADDLYLLAHHEMTGRPLLQQRASGIGLAGALLAELMLSGNISSSPSGIALASGNPPQEELTRSVLAVVHGEPGQRATRDWLLFLARTATTDVGQRLELAGYLTRASARRPWRGERWVPVDADCAFAPLARVQSVLDSSRPAATYCAALAGLAMACGLGSRLSDYAPPNARRLIREALAQLKPDLRDLIAQTEAAVNSALLSHRV